MFESISTIEKYKTTHVRFCLSDAKFRATWKRSRAMIAPVKIFLVFENKLAIVVESVK